MTDTINNAFPSSGSSEDDVTCCGASCETILGSDLLTKVAVYWPAGAVDRDGERAVGTPQEVACHWEDNYIEAVDVQGKTFISVATVFLAEQVKVGGWLWLGTTKVCDPAGTALAEADTLGLTADPPQNQMIRSLMRNPDIDNIETLWRAQL